MVYGSLLKWNPILTNLFYVGFNSCGFGLGLQPEKEPATNKIESVIRCQGVNHINETYKNLIALEAIEHDKQYSTSAEIYTATTANVFGNIIGIFYNTTFQLEE